MLTLTLGEADGGQLSDYEYNLFKINPSDATFKHIIPGEETSDSSDTPNHPLNIIKGLMIKNFKPIKNLGIIASLTKSESGVIALREVIRDLLDNEYSNIHPLISDSIQNVLSNRSSLEEELEAGDFGRNLFRAYGCGSLTEFAVTIYMRASLNSRAATTSRLKQELSGLLTGYRPRFTDDEITVLCNAIMTEIEPIGMFLHK